MFWLKNRQKLRRLLIRAVVLCMIGSSGCASISVRHAVRPDPIAQTGLSPAALKIAGSSRPSDSIILAAFDSTSPESAPTRLLATAELAYQAATRARSWSTNEAFRWYAASARQTYLYLSEQTEAIEPDARAFQLYNGAVAHCLRLALKERKLNPQMQTLSMNLDDSQPAVVIPIQQVGFYRDSTEFGQLELCEDLQVIGIERVHNSQGVGVPVLIHRTSATRSDNRPYEPGAITFPATAVLHFDGPTNAPTRLELANPLTVESASVHDLPWELSADFTTPLAKTVAQSPLERLAYVGFLRSDCVRNTTGIRMLEPYQPGKIPVLFVHGLASSPVTWVPLFNDLLADPKLRHQYQFWSYFYPTADPFPTSSADLREALVKIRQDLDPDKRDLAFDQMVLVGHSMGGLLCKMMTVDSGADFTQVVSQQPFDSLDLSPKVCAELKRTFCFQRQTNIKRVIFIATPHRGSSLSRGVAGKLANSLVRLRNELTEANKEMIRKIPDLPDGHVPTSVELLAPNSRALLLLAQRPKAPEVHYHSIIGVEVKGKELAPAWLREPSEQSDGVVPYLSAHLEAAESERVVAAEHSRVHQTIETTEEVRRILLEHLETIANRKRLDASRSGHSKL